MRLFFGIELDDRVRAAAAGVAARVRTRVQRTRTGLTARWVDPENLHITLWFLGELTDARAAEVHAVLARPFGTPAFALTVKGCGVFPRTGPPRVFWLGASDAEGSMVRLHGELQGRLVALGFEPDKRPYSPHVTIARVKDAGRGAPGPLRETIASVPANCGTCRVEAVVLFRSRLSPRGSRYEPLLRVPLS